MRKILAAFAALTLGLSGVLAMAAPASAGPNHTDKKVTICHATGSVTNPYVLTWVNDDAVDMATNNDKGKGDHNATHNGPIFDPNGGKDQPVWGDIIPPFYVGDNAPKSLVEGKAGTWPSKNWDDAGVAIWKNGCVVPDYVAPEETTVMVDFFDPTCDADAGIMVEYNAKEVDVVVTGDVAAGETVKVTFTAKEGYVIEGEDTFTHTYGDVPSDEVCDPTEPPVDPEDPKDPEEPNTPNPPQNQPPTELPGTGASDVLPWAGLGLVILLSGLLTHMVITRRSKSLI